MMETSAVPYLSDSHVFFHHCLSNTTSNTREPNKGHVRCKDSVFTTRSCCQRQQQKKKIGTGGGVVIKTGPGVRTSSAFNQLVHSFEQQRERLSLVQRRK